MRLNQKLGALVGAVALAGGLAIVSAVPANAAAPAKIDVTLHHVTCNDLIGKIKFGVPLTLGGTLANTITVTAKSGDCSDTTAGAYDCADGDPDNTLLPTNNAHPGTPIAYTHAAGTTDNVGPAGPGADGFVDQGDGEGCANPLGISLKQYTGKGVLNSSTNDCLGLSGLSTATSGEVDGTFATTAPAVTTISNNNAPGKKWATSRSMVSGKNTIHVTQTYGGTFDDGGSTSFASDSASWGAEYGLFEIGVLSKTPTSSPTLTGAFSPTYTSGPHSGQSTLQFDGTTAQSQGDLATACFSTGIKGIQFGIGGFST